MKCVYYVKHFSTFLSVCAEIKHKSASDLLECEFLAQSLRLKLFMAILLHLKSSGIKGSILGFSVLANFPGCMLYVCVE